MRRDRSVRWRRGDGPIGGAGAALLLAVAPAPLAAQAGGSTPAGTAIVNTAAARHGAEPPVLARATLVVAERLDVSLEDARLDSGGIGVTLVNRGNGREGFRLDATLQGGNEDGAALPIAVGDADAAPQPAPVLAAGGSVRLRVPLAPAALASAASLVVTAHALTGGGAPGTTVAGRGDGGGDAVVGATGAAARLAVPLAGVAWQPPVIAIAQSVEAPDGSSTPARGAVVTYVIDARFPAATPRGELVDQVPAGTSYRPGTLRLDGAPIADAGRVAANRVTVPLGAIAAGERHQLTFQVVIS